MNKISQVPSGPPPGSNPSTSDAVGATNMPLNGQQQGQQEQGLTLKKFNSLMDKIINESMSIGLSAEIENAISESTRPEVREKLIKILNSSNLNGDKRKLTRNPDNLNQRDPTPIELAKKYKEEVNKLVKGNAVYNNRTAQQAIKPKKKTRGNPFRVLMGKVGKLLDHGVEKNDIVRFLAKLKYWNNETVERAVDIVRDYNKKKNRDTKKEKSIKEQKNVKDKIENELEKHAETENIIRTAGLDYDAEPDYSKSSTAELIMRTMYLSDLLVVDKNTKQGDFKDPVSKKGVAQKLSAIKKALTDRGFDKEELENLGLGN
jgi:hypothetical protein